ncbi:acyltransferase family protein [Limosilactobacillus fermentum]
MTRRIFWIDYAKGFTIFIVVLAHACGQMNNNLKIGNPVLLELIRILMYFSFLFIMPVFFALSGYLFKPVKNFNEYKLITIKKCVTLGIPYIVFSLLLYGISLATGMHIDGINGLLSLVFIFIKPFSYLWFLLALLYIFIFVNFCFLIKISIRAQIAICFVLGFIQTLIFSNGDCMSQFFIWSLCFYIGFLLKKFNLLNRMNTKIVFNLLVVISLFIVIQLYWDKSWYEHANGFNLLNLLPKLLGIFLFFYWYKKTPKNSFTLYFTKYGKISLAIYLLHFPLISIIRRGLELVSISNPIVIFLLCLILSWYGSIWCQKILNKLKPLDFIIFPNRYLKGRL